MLDGAPDFRKSSDRRNTPLEGRVNVLLVEEDPLSSLIRTENKKRKIVI